MTMIKGRRAGMVTVALMLAVVTGCVRVVREDPPAPLPDGELAVRLAILEGPGGGTMALVPVMIAGQGPFTFALDTGASHSLLDREIAEQLNLSVGETPIEVTGVGPGNLTISPASGEDSGRCGREMPRVRGQRT